MTKANLIKNRMCEMCTHIIFDYNNLPCGIDPLSKSRIDMWYGDKCYTAKSFDEAMEYPLFDGKSLKYIADKVENLEL